MIVEVLLAFSLNYAPEDIFGAHCDHPTGCEVALSPAPAPDVDAEPAPEPSEAPSGPDPAPEADVDDGQDSGPAECHEKDPNCWIADDSR